MSDVEIKHKKVAGVTGYKRWGCRCPECSEAGRKLRDASNERDRRRRAVARDRESIPHGYTGYRNYGCRCLVCLTAGEARRAERREADRERRLASSSEPVVDWNELAHLVPGAGVRRKKS